MTDESAKLLAEAITKLAAAIEKAMTPAIGGVHIYHHGAPQWVPQVPTPYVTPYIRPMFYGNTYGSTAE